MYIHIIASICILLSSCTCCGSLWVCRCSLVSPSRWARNSASHPTWTPHEPPPWRYLSLCPVRGPNNVVPGGSRSHQAFWSRYQLLAKWWNLPGLVHCVVHVVLPTESCLLPFHSLRHHCLFPGRHRPVSSSVPCLAQAMLHRWSLFSARPAHPWMSAQGSPR